MNLSRGSSSFGGLFFNRGKTTIFKTDDTRYCPYFPAEEYIAHLRAPTGDQRAFSGEHSHPFECGEWIVAHNGIITNYEKFSCDRNVVDSSVIPQELEIQGFDCFSKFNGTWACWMYKKSTKELFITRSDNTLFYNPLNGDFSSVQIEGYEPLPEHKVFKILPTGIEEVFSYKTKPLYFVP